MEAFGNDGKNIMVIHCVLLKQHTHSNYAKQGKQEEQVDSPNINNFLTFSW